MKKLICMLTAVTIIASCNIAYADMNHGSDTPDNGMELTATPVESIIGNGENTLTAEEADLIAAEAANAIENRVHPENMDQAEKYIEIKIPDQVTIEAYNDPETRSEFTARAEAAHGIIINLLSDTPEYFYLGQRITVRSTTTNRLYSFMLEMNDSEEGIEATQRKLDKTVEAIFEQMSADGVDPEGTEGSPEERAQADFDRALWVHDYLVKTVTYDPRGTSHDKEEQAKADRRLTAALLDHYTVCQGYSNAYKYLLNAMGMECVNVYSDTDAHEWSAVKIGGEWYYVDTTQDDSDELGVVPHDFFLVTQDELLGGGTHKDGYITEATDENEPRSFGDAYEGKEWHAVWKTVTDENGETTREWKRGNISTAIIFNKKDRYYAAFDSEEIRSVIYKCGADLETNTEEIYSIDDGVWYIDRETSGSRLYVSGYHGGLSMYGGKLYFNSPRKIYCIDPAQQPIEATEVLTYEPEESENLNCLFGTDASSVLNYESADIVVENFEVSFVNNEIHSKIIDPCTVNFYDAEDAEGTEGEENKTLIKSVVVPRNRTISEIPDYVKYGYIVTGWKESLEAETLWDFENDAVTEDELELYAVTAEAEISVEDGANTLAADENGLLTGAVTAEIKGADPAYQTFKYIIAVYNDGLLSGLKSNTDGTFEFTAEDNIACGDGTVYKIFAWHDDITPLCTSKILSRQENENVPPSEET